MEQFLGSGEERGRAGRRVSTGAREWEAKREKNKRYSAYDNSNKSPAVTVWNANLAKVTF